MLPSYSILFLDTTHPSFNYQRSSVCIWLFVVYFSPGKVHEGRDVLVPYVPRPWNNATFVVGTQIFGEIININIFRT